MIVSAKGSVFRLLQWQWKLASLFVIVAAMECVCVLVFDQTWMRLPSLPLIVVGAALGIFVSFRTNSAYDRWWEGRMLWGKLVNDSRHWSNQVKHYILNRSSLPPPPEGESSLGRTSISTKASYSALQRRLIRRHAAYVHALRCSLREEAFFQDEDIKRLLGEEEREQLRGKLNVNHALLEMQLGDLNSAAEKQLLNEFRLQSMDRTLASLLDVQGGCERIKKTPMPRGYGFIATRLTIYFGCLFPLAVIEELGWVTIPVNLLVSLSFALISEAGRVLEDPFTTYWNGLPLHQLSRMIEVNIRQVFEEETLPEVPKPSSRGILM